MGPRLKDDIRLAANLLGQALALLEAAAEGGALSTAEREEIDDVVEALTDVHRRVHLFP